MQLYIYFLQSLRLSWSCGRHDFYLLSRLIILMVSLASLMIFPGCQRNVGGGGDNPHSIVGCPGYFDVSNS